MGSILAILRGAAQLVGLADALQRWLDRRQAEHQGERNHAAADDAASLQEAKDAQRTEAALAGTDRDALIDSLSGTPAGDK